jgi:hypothetical protein
MKNYPVIQDKLCILREVHFDGEIKRVHFVHVQL